MAEMSEAMRAAFAAIEVDPMDTDGRIKRAIRADALALYVTEVATTHETGVGLFLHCGDADVRIELTNDKARELASYLMDAVMNNINRAGQSGESINQWDDRPSLSLTPYIDRKGE